MLFSKCLRWVSFDCIVYNLSESENLILFEVYRVRIRCFIDLKLKFFFKNFIWENKNLGKNDV